jgi:1-acyl-sn-glycerol-3-phosphate acyltransferase
MLTTIRASIRLILLACVIISLLGTVLALAVWPCAQRSRREKRVAKLMQRHLGRMGRVAGLRIRVAGPLPPADRPFLLLSNHVSYWDILALGSLFPLGFMAKDCVGRWPVLGTVTRLCNTIFVDRGCVRGRWRALRTLQRKVQELPYCVFPEGTTTGSVAPRFAHWRRGNIAVLRDPGAEVWLAGLHYQKHKLEAWVDDDALLPHLFNRLKEPSILLTIQFKAFCPGDIPLAQAATEAWHQTVLLCEKAAGTQTDAPRLRALTQSEDSAVS